MPSPRPKRFPIWLVLSLCIAAVTWIYIHRILIPWSDAKDQQQNHIQSQLWDIYPRWVGARELLLHGKNPYSPEVSHEIQTAFYGRAATPEEEARHLIDEQRFAYPVYVVFLLAPTIHSNFATVQWWAPVVLGLFAALTVIFAVKLLDWRLSWSGLAAIVLLTLSSPQVVQGMRHQQLSILVACLLTAAAWCVRRNHLAAAGFLLAWATIKPQMAVLPLLWFAVWIGGDVRTRWRLLGGFTFTLAVLGAAGEFFVRGWTRDFLAAMAAYQKYFPTTSILRMFLGNVVGWLLSAAILLWLFVFAWHRRKVHAEAEEFVQVFAAFLMVSLLVFPLFTPFNQAMLILPVLMVVREWAALSKPARYIFVAVIAWPWITSAVLLAFDPAVIGSSTLPLLPSVTSPAVPVLLPLLLMARHSTSQEAVDSA